MKYTSEKIGKIIKEQRTKLKYSQDRLGSKLGISGKQISNYEKGILTPPIDIMFSICDIFNCELGYLIGEEDYSSGTKIETAINNSLGLNNETIQSIKRITGNEKNCLSFGHESEDYRRIINSFISNPAFEHLIEALYDLDRSVSNNNKIWSELETKYGKDTLDRAFEYYNSSTDYLHDDTAETIDEIYYQAMADIDNAIDKSRDTSFSIKVLRYESREAFERLLDNLYPQK